MNNEAGTDSLTVVAFSDGTFYALGVRPGVWVATVPETILQRLGGRVTPIRFEVGSDPASSIVEALEIRIERN